MKVSMTSREFWNWWCETSPPDVRSREATLNIPGEIKKGGGNNNAKGRKKKKPNSLPSQRYLLF